MPKHEDHALILSISVFSTHQSQEQRLTESAACNDDNNLNHEQTSAATAVLSPHQRGTAIQYHNDTAYKPGIQRVQAFADISCSAICCHSNKTRAPIANLPNSAQLWRTSTIPPSYIGSVQYCGHVVRDRQTHSHRWP